MKGKLGNLTMALGLLLLAPVALAHHSFEAEYDRSQPVKVKGVVTKVEWTNPHIWFYVDVKDESGKLTNWAFSGSPPGLLRRRGVTKESVPVGSILIVEGFRARDGSNNSYASSVTFEDGRKAFTGNPTGEETDKK